MRGRKPIPNGILKLRGSKRVKKNEVVVPHSIPDCPAELDDIARSEWNRIISRLDGLGLMTQLDSVALEMYCSAYSRWKRADAKAYNQEVIVTRSGNSIQNPYLGIANRAYDQLKAIIVEFGLTPSSRTRVKAEKKIIKDDKERFFKQEYR